MEAVAAGMSFLFIALGLYFVIKKAVSEGINSSQEIKKLRSELRMLHKELKKDGNKIDKKI
ncbi:hypothetical protein FZC84_09880 [Rossellomorea vietnamensis]|uniref:Uncharacterized protein n=1 Tax=Rossellomorea vietnamensis TaxID=218284 RepID=A0A5D4MD47_9BACI|nr:MULTISPECIES: hypothetical protein [Bacillaceae]TYR99536.1 hypothetical protein FZC84_09880 [Rossellomorea vietnamensis]